MSGEIKSGQFGSDMVRSGQFSSGEGKERGVPHPSRLKSGVARDATNEGRREGGWLGFLKDLHPSNNYKILTK